MTENIFKNDWMAARSRPLKERFMRYPLLTLGAAMLERTLRGTFRTRTFFGEYFYAPYPKYRSIFYHGMIDGSEVPLTEYLWNTLTKNDVFFDIGTNIGFYSLLASVKAKEVHSFEPFPATFKELQRNLRPNIVANNVALMDHDGTFYMQEGKESGLNRIAQEGATSVRAITLDSYCQSRRVWPTVLKIDVEGSEPSVLRGATEVLKRKPIVLAEMLENTDEIRSILKSSGYVEMPFSPTCKNSRFITA